MANYFAVAQFTTSFVECFSPNLSFQETYVIFDTSVSIDFSTLAIL